MNSDRPVRVWQLAERAGLSSAEVLDRLQRLGIEVSSHAATVSAPEADRFWAALDAERDDDDVRKVRVYELARRLDLDTNTVLELLRGLGVHATSHASTVWEFDADRLLENLDSVHDHPAAAEDPVVITFPRPAQRPAEDTAAPESREPTRTELDEGLLARVAGEIGPHWKGVLAIVVFSLLAIPLALLTPVPLKIAVDSVLGDDAIPRFLDPVIPDSLTTSDLRLLLAVVGLQVAIVLASQLQSLGSYVAHTRTGERLTVRFRSVIFRHAQRLSLAHHYAHGPTDALYRVQYDARSLRDLLDASVPLISSTVMLAATLFVTARISMQLALVALAVVPVLFALARGYSTRVRGRYRSLAEKESAAMGVVQETLSAVEVVKAFGREDDEQRRFVARSDETVRARVALAFAESGFAALINLVTAVGTAAVLFIGVRSVMQGALKLGELLVVMSYLAQLYTPLKQVSQKAGDVQSSLAGAERAFALLDQQPEVHERPDARPLERAEGRLAFQGVWFSYDGRTDVLRDVSFEIRPGARVGLAGRTGAGKTTMVSLMLRFYDPTAGRILLDGTDLRDYRLEDLRDQFALVLQKPVLFSTSVAENIRYARPDASFGEVVAAARAAQLEEFVLSLPDGFDTVVGDQGMRLSGGERQRVSLARAFLRDAPILVLDEPTSSVDQETEASIMEALDRLMAGRTTIMIAHRLSTLDHCDALLEISDGAVRLGDLRGGRPPERASA